MKSTVLKGAWALLGMLLAGGAMAASQETTIAQRMAEEAQQQQAEQALEQSRDRVREQLRSEDSRGDAHRNQHRHELRQQNGEPQMKKGQAMEGNQTGGGAGRR